MPRRIEVSFDIVGKITENGIRWINCPAKRTVSKFVIISRVEDQGVVSGNYLIPLSRVNVCALPKMNIYGFFERNDLRSDLDVDLAMRKLIVKRSLINKSSFKYVLGQRHKSRDRRGRAADR